MYSLLKKYSESNPERFNDAFIASKSTDDFLEPITDILKSLEIIDEIEILDVHFEGDESQIGPMKNYDELSDGTISPEERPQGEYRRGFKPIHRGRLNKIVFTARITPQIEVEPEPILVDDRPRKTVIPNNETYTVTKELFLNKLVDKYFFINDDIKYFLIYQLTDKGFYRVNDAVCLKSLLMPITLKRNENLLFPEFGQDPVEVWDYESLLFSKRINPIYYMLAKEAYNSIINVKATAASIIEARMQYRDANLFNWINDFFGAGLKFSDDKNELIEDGRLIFQVKNNKAGGVYLSVDEKLVREDVGVASLVSAMVNFRRGDNKKKNQDIYSYDDLISPWFWIDYLASYFTKTTDPVRRFDKVRGVLYSLERLLGEGNRKGLPMPEEVKKNIFTIFRYVMYNFNTILYADSQHLKFQKIRFWEPLLVGLQTYISNHIFRILNSTTRSKVVLDKVFSGLKKNYILTSTSVNELFRYHNSSNAIMDLYGVGLRYSRSGVQALGKSASAIHKDLHDSYVGRVSLVTGTASTSGIVGVVCPMAEFEDNLREFKLDEEDN